MTAQRFTQALTALFAAVIFGLCVVSAEDTPAPISDKEGVGVWSTRYGGSDVYIFINEDRTAYLVWLMKGGHQIMDAKWVPAIGGMIVYGPIRFRFWLEKQNGGTIAKVEMEQLPLDMLGEGIRTFPSALYMKKERNWELKGPFFEEFAKRPVPDAWNAEKAPLDFDQRARKPRLPE
ncbi:MAG: hypothetical protein QE267_04360 [Akkermansiaceae bacterium]|nr:hypothetical protein [Akkermansiaceae bacterium]